MLVVVALAAGAVAAARLTGGDARPAARLIGDAASPASQPAERAPAAKSPRPEPAPLPGEMRGVHVTMSLASLDGKLAEYFALTRDGLNTIELDVKDESGEVAFRRPKVPLARAIGAADAYYDPRAVAAKAERKGVYLIGRVVVFEDPVLAARRPALAVHRRGGGVWVNSAGLGWTNPYDRRVWKYNVDVAEAAVRAGFDEIMFDYVRFPTDGDVGAAAYPHARREPKATTIARFLAYARQRLAPLGARVSAAVFGLAATRDLGIGQRPRRLSRYLDAVYPMVYPSHYAPGEHGLPDPNAVPRRTVALSLRDFRRALRGRKAALIPWLQDFSLGRAYSPADVRAQIAAARDVGTRGFLLWNAEGVYTTAALRSR